MTEEQEWVQNAMSDDALVVDMLLRLNRAEPPTIKTSSPPLQLEWTVRQRRSKQVVRKKGAEPTRASPTTPLSWSGATTTSASGGATPPAAADGFEESSKPSLAVDNPRSKVVGTNETTTTKKPRKKKTLAELKVEEDCLMKERRNLKNQLASLRVNVEKERAANEQLKRMKLDIVPHQTTETVQASPATQEAISKQQPHQMEVECGPSGIIVPAKGASINPNPSVSNTSSKVQEDGSRMSSFMLPDLNLPVEGNSGSGDLYGIS